MVAQEQHPGVKRAGNDGEQTGAGHQIEPALPVGLDGRGPRRNALATYDDGLNAVRSLENDRHVTARTVEMRFDDLQGKAGGNGGVERVAATLQ